MSRNYATEAIVLGSHKLGEADRVVTLLTRDRGKVPTVVKGVRKLKSRFGGRLEPFTVIQAQLYAGRNLHTLTGADTVATHASIRDLPATLQSGLAFADMLNRAIPEFETRPRTFNLMLNYLEVADRIAREARAVPGGDHGSRDPAAAACSLTYGAQLKLLLLAGYLPHLSHCASCGADGPLTRFSAAEGGALCPDCSAASFTISDATLDSMRHLLEHPLSDAASIELDKKISEEIRQCLREVCRYHLGFDLKLKPL